MKKRESVSRISLSDSQKKQMLEEIKAFYLTERGEEIGIIGQMQLLDFFQENMAPIIYNKALDDARRWFTQALDNLDCDYYALYQNDRQR